MKFLRVESAFSSPLGELCTTTWGGVACSAGASAAQRGGEPLLCVASGMLCAADGSAYPGEAEPTIAIVEQVDAPGRGEVVRVGGAPFRKPRGVSWDFAARLPLLLLTAFAALEQAGVPESGGAARGKTVPTPALPSNAKTRASLPQTGPSLTQTRTFTNPLLEHKSNANTVILQRSSRTQHGASPTHFSNANTPSV